MRQLEEVLARWRRGDTASLLTQLGFELVGFHVPATSLPDFGVDATEPLTLEVAARHRSFHVFRITFVGRLEPEAIRRIGTALYRHNPTRRALLIFDAASDSCLVFASWGLGPGPFRLLKLWIDLKAPRRSELDILSGLAVNGAITASELAIAHAQALDREGVTRKFFLEFRRHRAELGAAITGVPSSEMNDRLDLALVLLSRLLFLYFIQRKGWLDGDPAYLRSLYDKSCRSGVPFYRGRLKHLFFSALNRPANRRGQRALELGELPYLNGGLFERDPLDRKHPRMDVPNECFLSIFNDLLDKYQFTLREDQPADQDVAVDPEMLGRVFEGLMASDVRGSTGAFFTPRALVDRLVDGAFSAHLVNAVGIAPDIADELLAGNATHIGPQLRERLAPHVRSIRVLDPAVGSGAFLLAALHRLERLREALDGGAQDSFARFQRRQEIIRSNLHGVDINGAAVKLCELRLWLALIVDLEVDSIALVPPLPNLDINIRQGDALIDPIDFLVQVAGLDDSHLAARWSRAAGRLVARRDRYFHAAGSDKRRVARALRDAERDFALSFLSELAAQIDERRRDLQTAARSKDLFGARAGLDRRQRRAARSLKQRRREIGNLLKRISEVQELPFFSFQIHFAQLEEAGPRFDVVLGNPPWVRTQHWTGLPRARLKERFQCLREAGWRAGSRLAGAGAGFGAQLDLSALFLERSLELLAEGGALGSLIPAKLMRTLSSGALRQRLLKKTRLVSLEDCSLSHKRLFAGTTYPLALLLTQGAAKPAWTVEIRLHDRRQQVQTFDLPQAQLPVLPDDDEAPWALAPPSVRAAIDRMRAAGPALGTLPGLRPRRGILTGANDVFLGELVAHITATHAEMHPSGHAVLKIAGTEVEIEAERVRPVLRGEDLTPWQFCAQSALIWTHDDAGNVLASLPPFAQRHVRKHQRVLRRRADLKPGQRTWSVFRADPQKWALRVAWRDIGTEPSAVVVPGCIPFLGAHFPIISLNTVYQIAPGTEDEAHFLAAILNSVPVRAFLKAVAQRASGGHFRFFGSTVGLLPFPIDRDHALRRLCAEISGRAHEAGSLAPDDRETLDEAIAGLYELSSSDLAALRAFDSSLSDPSADPSPDPKLATSNLSTGK